jgi:adenylate kinase
VTEPPSRDAPLRLVLLGAPGSGKGTQGGALADRFGIRHVSSGELLRRHVARGSELGHRASGYLERGELVPDDLVMAVMADELAAADSAGGYVVEGFPRTVAQAEGAKMLPGGDGLAGDVVFLDVPDDIVRERLARRAGTGRVDDAHRDVIERRLRVFHAETEPLLDFYRQRGLLTTVDAVPPPDDVTAAILTALAARHRPA